MLNLLLISIEPFIDTIIETNKNKLKNILKVNLSIHMRPRTVYNNCIKKSLLLNI